MIRFLHIPKSAGTTFSEILRNEYGNGINCIHYIDNGEEEKINKENFSLLKKEFSLLSENEKNNIKLIIGHIPIKTGISYIDKKFQIITFMREPVSLVKSKLQHYFEGKDPTSETKRNNFMKLLESKKDYFSNHQAKMLTKTFGKNNFKDDKIILEKAKENLLKLSSFGMVESFDESILLFFKILKWENTPYYKKLNIKSKIFNIKFSKNSLEKIIAYNKIDLNLYRFAKDLFKKRIKRELDKKEVELFKKENKLIRKALNWDGKVYNATASKRKNELRGVIKLLKKRNRVILNEAYTIYSSLLILEGKSSWKKYYMKAIENGKSLNMEKSDPIKFAKLFINIGKIDRARAILENFIASKISLLNKYYLIDSLILLADIEFPINKPLYLEYNLRALTILEKIKIISLDRLQLTGKLYWRIGKAYNSIRIFKEIIRKSKDFSLTFFSYYKIGEIEKSLGKKHWKQNFKKAVRISNKIENKTNHELYMLSIILKELRDNVGAIKEIKKIIKGKYSQNEPSLIFYSYILYSEILKETGKKQWVIYLKKGLEIGERLPLIPTIFILRKYLLYNDINKVLKVLKKGKRKLKFSEGEKFIYMLLEKLLTKKKKINEKEKRLIEKIFDILQKEKIDAFDYFFLGKKISFEIFRDLESGEKLFRKVIEYNKKCRENACFEIIAKSYFYLAEISSLLKKNNLKPLYMKAIENINRKRSKDGNDYYFLGSMFKRMRNYEQAINYFMKVVNNKKNDYLSGGVFFHLGEIMLKKGDNEKAEKYFKECIKIENNHKKAIKYLKTLEKEKNNDV
jgi:tetratricopeptide (TPR) repeat protein